MSGFQMQAEMLTTLSCLFHATPGVPAGPGAGGPGDGGGGGATADLERPGTGLCGGGQVALGRARPGSPGPPRPLLALS